MAVFEKSSFVWTSDTPCADEYAEFYTNLQIAGNSAICRISADSDYTLFINGKYVSSGQYGDYEHYKIYDEIDISSFIHTGQNSFCVLCWYFGEDSQRYKKYNAGVIFEVAEGDSIVLSSNENILARKSKTYVSGFKRHISSQLGFSFRYDSSYEDSWLYGELDGFENAVRIDKKCDFYPRPIKNLLLGETVYAKPISETDESLIFDLGREYVGLITLEAEGFGDVNIAYGECLKNGHVKRHLGNRNFSLDYVCDGSKGYTNYMLRLACRYIEIRTQGSAKITSVGIIPQYYGVKDKECSFISGVDKQIYDICVNTLHLCMMEHYVDCPWREQCLYAFDSRNQMLCGYYAFEDGNFEYARANLLLLAKSQRADGILAICSPCGVNLAIPSFSLYFVIAMKEYCEHSGDTEFFITLKDTVKGILDAFLSREQNGLIQRFHEEGYWNFYDWSLHLDGSLGCTQTKGTDLMLCSLVILALNAYEGLCDMSGLDFEYRDTKKRLICAAKHEFFDTESGFFRFNRDTVDALELPNALAVLSGLCDNDEARDICDALRDNRLSECSLSMKCFKYDAMLLCDKNAYLEAVLGEIRSTYEKMIPVGTVWETSLGESDFDDAGSLCHGWSAIPIFYYRKLSESAE